MSCGQGDAGRHEPDGADIHASPAADAGGALSSLEIGRAEHSDAARSLGDRHAEVSEGEAHHRAARDDSNRFLPESAGGLDQGSVGDTDRHEQVFWRLDSRSGDRDDAVREGLSAQDGPCDCGSGAHVDDNHSDIERQAARRHRAPERREDELLLGPLRVFRSDREDFDTRTVGRAAHGLDSLRLVVFDPDDDAIRARGPCRQKRPTDDRPWSLDHQAVVRREVGLALATVDQQGVDGSLGISLQLDRGGEGGAPHADQARISHRG